MKNCLAPVWNTYYEFPVMAPGNPPGRGEGAIVVRELRDFAASLPSMQAFLEPFMNIQ